MSGPSSFLPIGYFHVTQLMLKGKKKDCRAQSWTITLSHQYGMAFDDSSAGPSTCLWLPDDPSPLGGETLSSLLGSYHNITSYNISVSAGLQPDTSAAALSAITRSWLKSVLRRIYTYTQGPPRFRTIYELYLGVLQKKKIQKKKTTLCHIYKLWFFTAVVVLNKGKALRNT